MKQAIDSREKQLDETVIAARQDEWEKGWQQRIPDFVEGGLVAWYELDGNTSDVSGHFRHARIAGAT